MNATGRENFLTWVVLICGIVLFLVLAYATVILWNAANPVPVVSEQKISKEQAVETAVEHFANVYRLSDTNGLEGSARVMAVPLIRDPHPITRTGLEHFPENNLPAGDIA